MLYKKETTYKPDFWNHSSSNKLLPELFCPVWGKLQRAGDICRVEGNSQFITRDVTNLHLGRKEKVTQWANIQSVSPGTSAAGERTTFTVSVTSHHRNYSRRCLRRNLLTKICPFAYFLILSSSPAEKETDLGISGASSSTRTAVVLILVAIPGSAQGQEGWGVEQPGLVPDILAHGRGLGTRLSFIPTILSFYG